MTTIDELEDLDGLISSEIGEYLRTLAMNVPSERAIVEIGSYRGKSTAYLALGSVLGESAVVYAVDPWEQLNVTMWCRHCRQPTRAEFETQLAGVGLLDHVQIRQGLSSTVARTYDGPPIALLFIDGAHDAFHVALDVRSWREHLADAALLVFDDYGVTANPGVARAIAELVQNGELQPPEVVLQRLALTRLS